MRSWLRFEAFLLLFSFRRRRRDGLLLPAACCLLPAACCCCCCCLLLLLPSAAAAAAAVASHAQKETCTARESTRALCDCVELMNACVVACHCGGNTCVANGHSFKLQSHMHNAAHAAPRHAEMNCRTRAQTERRSASSMPRLTYLMRGC